MSTSGVEQPVRRPAGKLSVSTALRRLLPLGVLLAASTLLRVLVVVFIPNFYGPGDPALYFDMARNCAHLGVPEVGFIHHFYTWPHTIGHMEDYYEPAYGYLLALPMCIFGSKIIVAKAVSVVFGVLTIAAVYVSAGRYSRRVALLAAALVAFEPWSIYYSGLIMKEVTVACVVAVYIYCLRGGIESPQSARRAWSLFGIATVLVSLLQYELLPILAVTTAVALRMRKRQALVPYLLAVAIAGALLLAATLVILGVPISAKFNFFLGANMADPLPKPVAHGLIGVARTALPVVYIVGSILVSYYLIFLVLAWTGARRLERDDATAAVAFPFLLSFLYFHGVPHDLWSRDFIVITAVLAPLVARGIVQSREWLSTIWGWPLTHGMGAAGVAAYLLSLLKTGPIWFARGGYSPDIVVASGVVAIAAFVFSRRIRSRRMRGAPVAGAPALLIALVAAQYWGSLPMPAIYRNGQFPTYEQERARWENVCAYLRRHVEPGSILAGYPCEIHLYTGMPTVRLPMPAEAPKIQFVRSRYGIRYMILRQADVSIGVLRALRVEPVVSRGDLTLWRFTDALSIQQEPKGRLHK